MSLIRIIEEIKPKKFETSYMSTVLTEKTKIVYVLGVKVYTTQRNYTFTPKTTENTTTGYGVATGKPVQVIRR